MSSHTPGPWRPGNACASVVSDTPIENGINGGDAVEFYGGHLIAESIAPSNLKLIASAPAMHLVLRMIVAGIARIERSGTLVELCFEGLRYSNSDGDWGELMRFIGWDRAAEALAKAEGGAA